MSAPTACCTPLCRIGPSGTSHGMRRTQVYTQQRRARVSSKSTQPVGLLGPGKKTKKKQTSPRRKVHIGQGNTKNYIWAFRHFCHFRHFANFAILSILPFLHLAFWPFGHDRGRPTRVRRSSSPHGLDDSARSSSKIMFAQEDDAGGRRPCMPSAVSHRCRRRCMGDHP